jgi:hypothetical protein
MTSSPDVPQQVAVTPPQVGGAYGLGQFATLGHVMFAALEVPVKSAMKVMVIRSPFDESSNTPRESQAGLLGGCDRNQSEA